MTEAAKAARASRSPFTYVIGSKVFVVYVGQDQHLHLVWGDGRTEGWRTLDVTGADGALRMAGDPVVSSASGAARAFCRGADAEVVFAVDIPHVGG